MIVSGVISNIRSFLNSFTISVKVSCDRIFSSAVHSRETEKNRFFWCCRKHKEHHSSKRKILFGDLNHGFYSTFHFYWSVGCCWNCSAIFGAKGAKPRVRFLQQKKLNVKHFHFCFESLLPFFLFSRIVQCVLMLTAATCWLL